MNTIKFIVLLAAVLFPEGVLAWNWCDDSFFDDKKTDEYVGRLMVKSSGNWIEIYGETVGEYTKVLVPPGRVRFCICVPKSSSGQTDVLYIHVDRRQSENGIGRQARLFNNKLRRSFVADLWERIKSTGEDDIDYNFNSHKRNILFDAGDKAQVFSDFHRKAQCPTTWNDIRSPKGYSSLFLWHQQLTEVSCYSVRKALESGDVAVPEVEFLLGVKSRRSVPSWIPLELEIFPDEKARIVTLFSDPDSQGNCFYIKK